MNVRDESYTLNDGVDIPKVGLGVYLSQEGEEAYNSVRWALDCGYRHIDTAAFYGNEKSVGRAVRDSGISRDEIFITTKLWVTEQRYDDALKAFDDSRKKLNMDYVDLYLIHWPNKHYKYNAQAFEAMLNLKEKDVLRSAGVSNFAMEHLDDLIERVGVIPSVNQVENNPLSNRSKLKNYCDDLDIRIESWAPFRQGEIFGEKIFAKIGEKYSKTAAQVIIRWHVQSGYVAIPKSVKKQRIDENTDIFDFELSAADMADINSIPQLKTKLDPFNYKKEFDSYE